MNLVTVINGSAQTVTIGYEYASTSNLVTFGAFSRSEGVPFASDEWQVYGTNLAYSYLVAGADLVRGGSLLVSDRAADPSGIGVEAFAGPDFVWWFLTGFSFSVAVGISIWSTKLIGRISDPAVIPGD